MSAEDDPHRTSRPGPLAWAFVLAGWAVMAIAVAGMFRDPLLGSPQSWLTWVVGAAIIHDAVVLPLVVGTGWLLGRVLPETWRTPWRVALVIGAVLSLATFPIVRRWGARPDNPSILPLQAGRNLLVLLALIVVAAVAAAVVNTIRARRHHPTGVNS